MITKGVRTEICEVLSYRIFAVTEYPTSAEYTAICLGLVTKYPVLKDTIGNGYVSFFIILLTLVLLSLLNMTLFLFSPCCPR